MSLTPYTFAYLVETSDPVDLPDENAALDHARDLRADIEKALPGYRIVETQVVELPQSETASVPASEIGNR